MATPANQTLTLIKKPGAKNSTAASNQYGTVAAIQDMTGAPQTYATAMPTSRAPADLPIVYMNPDTPEKLAANAAANNARAAAPNPYAAPQLPQVQQPQQVAAQPAQPTNAQMLAQRMASMPSFADFSKQFMPTDDSDLYAREQQAAEAGSYADLFSQAIDSKWTANLAQQERDRAQKILDREKTQNIADIEAAYAPEADKLIWYLYQTGQMSSGEGTKQAEAMKKDKERRINDVNTNYADRAEQISTTFNNTVLQLQDKAQAAALQAKALLDARTVEIDKNKRASENDKQKFKYAMYSDYQNQLNKIQDSYFAEVRAEEDARDRALGRELQVASLTGTYKGNPTYEALTNQQKMERANLESDRDYQLAVDKFNYTIAQDALDRAAKKASGSGSAGLSVDEMNNRLKQNMSAIARGVDVTDSIGIYTAGMNAKQKSAYQELITTLPVTGDSPLPAGVEGPTRPATYLDTYLLRDQKREKQFVNSGDSEFEEL